MPLNTARSMVERIGFLCYLLLFVGSCGVVGLGLIYLLHREPRPLLGGLAGLLIVTVVRDHGYRHWHFRQWEESCEPVDTTPAVILDETRLERVQELERVLQELGNLNSTDAAEGRDIWIVQDLRHRANALLARDPTLREACAESLVKHPDVG